MNTITLLELSIRRSDKILDELLNLVREVGALKYTLEKELKLVRKNE